MPHLLESYGAACNCGVRIVDDLGKYVDGFTGYVASFVNTKVGVNFPRDTTTATDFRALLSLHCGLQNMLNCFVQSTITFRLRLNMFG